MYGDLYHEINCCVEEVKCTFSYGFLLREPEIIILIDWLVLSNLQTFMIFLSKRRVKILQTWNLQTSRLFCAREELNLCSIQIFKLAWFLCKWKSLILQSSNLKSCMIFSAKQGSNLKLPESWRPFLCSRRDSYHLRIFKLSWFCLWMKRGQVWSKFSLWNIQTSMISCTTEG